MNETPGDGRDREDVGFWIGREDAESRRADQLPHCIRVLADGELNFGQARGQVAILEIVQEVAKVPSVAGPVKRTLRLAPPIIRDFPAAREQVAGDRPYVIVPMLAEEPPVVVLEIRQFLDRAYVSVLL